MCFEIICLRHTVISSYPISLKSFDFTRIRHYLSDKCLIRLKMSYSHDFELLKRLNGSNMSYTYDFE